LVSLLRCVVVEFCKPNELLTPWLLHGDLASFEHADEGRSRDAEKVGRLLGGQAGVLRRDGDPHALVEGFCDLPEHVVHRFGQQEALAISANEFWSLCTALAQDGLQGRIDRPLGHVGSDVGASCCLGHVVAVLSSTRILKRTKRTTTKVGESKKSVASRSVATDQLASPHPRLGSGLGVAGGHRVALLSGIDAGALSGDSQFAGRWPRGKKDVARCSSGSRVPGKGRRARRH